MPHTKVTDAEIETIGSLLERCAWVNSATRAKIQKYGANVVPTDFYSNSPSIEDIQKSYEYSSEEPAYLDERIFDRTTMLAVLDKLSAFSKEFEPSVQGDEHNCEEFFWENSQFSYSDAMSYYCFIRKHQPQTILEIGSGFSTLVALEAIRRNGTGKIVCVEPFPRPFLENCENIELIKQPAQDLSPGNLNDWLDDGDFLFIDSTHTVKTGSDCLHIYLRILPKIDSHIYVHCHDIFLPFGLPLDWLLERQIYWTEQYLLLAFLIDNPRAKVLYGSAYHKALSQDKLDLMMGGKWPSGGASFWFQYWGS